MGRRVWQPLRRYRPRYHLRSISSKEMAHRINTDPAVLHELLTHLDAHSLSELQHEVSRHSEFQDKTKPTRRQLTLTALHAGIPFIGFGFLDNVLMILWGDAIEQYFG